MMNAKACATPCSSGSLDSSSPLCSVDDAKAYRSMVGALHYLTFTRPDISFTVSHVSQFMHAPTYLHLAAVKCILRYICGSLLAGLKFMRSSLSVSFLWFQLGRKPCWQTIHYRLCHFFWVVIPSLGSRRSKQRFSGAPLRPNTEPWLLLQLSYRG